MKKIIYLALIGSVALNCEAMGPLPASGAASKMRAWNTAKSLLYIAQTAPETAVEIMNECSQALLDMGSSIDKLLNILITGKATAKGMKDIINGLKQNADVVLTHASTIGQDTESVHNKLSMCLAYISLIQAKHTIVGLEWEQLRVDLLKCVDDVDTKVKIQQLGDYIASIGKDDKSFIKVQNKNTELQAKQKELESDIASKTKAIEKLRNKASEREEAYQQELANLKKQKSQSEQAYQRQLDELNEQKSQSEQAYQQKLADLESEKQQLSDKKSELEKQQQALQATYEQDLIDKTEKVRKQVEDEFKKRFAEQASTIVELRQQYEESQKSLSAKMKKLTQKESEIGRVQTDLNGVRKEKQELAKQLEEAEIKYKTMTSELEDLNEKYKSYRSSVESLNEMVADAESEKMVATEAFGELKNILEKMNSQCGKAKEKCEQLNGELQKAKEECEQLNGELQKAKEECEQLNGELQKVKEERKTLTDGLEAAEQQITSLKKDNASMRSNVEQLEDKNAEMKRKNRKAIVGGVCVCVISFVVRAVNNGLLPDLCTYLSGLFN